MSGYDYERCVKDIDNLARTVKNAEVFSIGESIMEKKILCISYGSGGRTLFLNGAHHGLEYITSGFLVRFMKELTRSCEDNAELLGYDVGRLMKKVRLYVVPMVNPDGVDIAVNGLDITNPHHRRLISMVGIHSFNKVWQANAGGVDINHNYDALWSVVERSPSTSKYGGEYPESEPETKAICDFVRENSFDMLMAFHSQGGEIYYDFDGLAAETDRLLAEKMSAASGYPVKTPVGSASFGGLKDWFIKEFGRSGFTVEMARGKNPIAEERIDEFYAENAKIILTAIQYLALGK